LSAGVGRYIRGCRIPGLSRIVAREGVAFDCREERWIRMAEEDRITLRVEDGTTVDAARVATALGRELVHEGVAVSTASGSAPEGAKSGIVITAGSLVITGAVSAQAVRSIGSQCR
jgi:hypothetical protein